MPLPIACLLAALSGALSVLGWAPFGCWPVALAGYVGLLWMVQQTAKASSAGLIGLAFGVGLHLTGHGWIYTALHSKTGLGIIPASLSTGLFVLYLAAFTAIPCWLGNAIIQRRSSPPTLPSCLIQAALYAGALTLGEWSRSYFFNGFTSLSLGYCLIDTWFAGYAPIAGLYGASWAGFCAAALLPSLIAGPRATRGVAMGTILLVAFSGWILDQVRWTESVGPSLSYRLIQANVAQEHKFDALYIRGQVQHLVAAIKESPADIIATPETAFPLFLNELSGDVLPGLQQFSQNTGSHVFMGIATTTANADGYNSVLQISPRQNSGELGQYNKVRLMPFGEYTPAGFGWFTRSLSIPLKDMRAGEMNQRPFPIMARNGTPFLLGTLICHEDLIGRDVRHWIAASTNLLLNPSNLAWFDGSLAIPQRLEIVRMRALEAGRPILRIANTGVTVHIDAHGKIVGQLSFGQEGVLSGRVQPATGLTPYMQGGDKIAVWVSVMGILLAAVSRYRAQLSWRPHAS